MSILPDDSALRKVKICEIPLASIRTDGDTQARVQLDAEVVAEYAEAAANGAIFPPLTIFWDGDSYWLSDGFHRLKAFLLAGLDAAECKVVEGARRDAVLSAVGANATHGIRRTNADKRKAVLTLLEDEEWSQWSDNEIARRCGVSHPFVGGLRGRASCNRYKMRDHVDAGRAAPQSVATTSPDDYDEDQDREDGTPADVATQPITRRVQRNGKTYEMQTGHIGKPAHTPDDSQDGPRDGEGTPLPDGLRDVFGDRALPECIANAEAALAQVAQLRVIGRIRSRLRHLPFVLAHKIEEEWESSKAALTSMIELLRAGIPYAVCPRCGGNGCQTCRQSGYLPQWRREELAEQDKLTTPNAA